MLGIHHMQQCTAQPWEKAFAERLCIRARGKGGYCPFTWLPMVMLAREQIAAKRAREGRAEKANKMASAANLDRADHRRLEDLGTPKPR